MSFCPYGAQRRGENKDAQAPLRMPDNFEHLSFPPLPQHCRRGRFRVWLFTDGQHNVDPRNPAGFGASLLDYQRATGFLPEIDAYGFGAHVDVKTLEAGIARTTRGLYANISSPDMVATFFVNSAADWLTVGASATLGPVDETWRNKLVTALREAYSFGAEGNLQGALAKVRDLSEGMRADGAHEAFLQDVETEVALSVSKPETFRAWGGAFLLCLASAHDLKRCANFKNASLQLYKTAEFEEHQARTETAFRSEMARIDAALAAADAARAAAAAARGASYVPPVRAESSGFYNAAGGCVDGECLALLADGTLVRIDVLKRGDIVATACGSLFGEITDIVKTAIKPDAQAVCFSGSDGQAGQKTGLKITAYHPIRIDSQESPTWSFPAHAADAQVSTAAALGFHIGFSFVVRGLRDAGETVHGMVVNNIVVATLAHQVGGDKVLSHPFWGSLVIAERIRAMNQWANDHNIPDEKNVVGTNGWEWVRDPETGLVCDLCFGIV